MLPDGKNRLILLTDHFYEQNDFKNTLLYNKYKRLLANRLIQFKDTNTVKAARIGEASYYLYFGDVSQKQGNYRQALMNYRRATDLYTVIGDEDQVGVILSAIASTYSSMGNYSESLRYSFKALDKHISVGNKSHVAMELNNIGAVYSDTRDLTKALEYYTKAMNISLKEKDKESTALYMGNIGHSYQMLCDSAYEVGNVKLSLKLQDQALEYYFKAVKISEACSDKGNMAVCLENIGIIYSNIYDYKQAMPYLIKALDIYKELDLKAEQSFCLNMLGEAYRGLGENKKAKTCFEEALRLAKEIGSNYFLMHANMGNSEFYEKTNRPAEALEYYKAYIANRDSIFNKEKTKALAYTELNYEFEKKEAATKHENDKVIYRLGADNKLYRQWRLFFIAIILLVLIVLFFIKRAYDNKKQLAELLLAEDQRKEVLLQEVHHRINNNLQIISSLLTLQANNAEDEKLTEYLLQSQNRIQSLSAMHELLHDTNSPLDINMKDYINKVLDFHRDVADSMPARITIEEEIESVKFPTKLAVPLALIINELVTNSLKYAFTNRETGFIKVSLRKNRNENNWIVSVKDNGVGLPLESEKRTGSLGLKLISIMTRQIGGIFEAKNETGAYFTLIFDLIKKK
ncbi:MAG: tetratricopeptide repeat protein [Bacteroidota bacterium]